MCALTERTTCLSRYMPYHIPMANIIDITQYVSGASGAFN